MWDYRRGSRNYKWGGGSYYQKMINKEFVLNIFLSDLILYNLIYGGI